MSTDLITLLVFLGFWPLWLGWEIYLLIRRGERVSVKTISMVARDCGYKVNSVVYIWCGLAAHFWWNGSASSKLGSIFFWVLFAVIIGYDIAFHLLDELATPPTKNREWYRNPIWWALVGILAGHFLFPQPPA